MSTSFKQRPKRMRLTAARPAPNPEKNGLRHWKRAVGHRQVRRDLCISYALRDMARNIL